MRKGLALARSLTLAALAALASSLASSLAMGCSTYHDQLARSQQSFEQNQGERTLGLLQALEPDMLRLATPEQAQYAYLRGMTDYRIGYRADARHWLSIAKTYDDASPGMLPTAWKSRMTEALEEMNGVVYTDGFAALALSRKPGEDTPLDSSSASPGTSGTSGTPKK